MLLNGLDFCQDRFCGIFVEDIQFWMPLAILAYNDTLSTNKNDGGAMAIVKHLEFLDLQVEAKHTDSRATYSLIKDGNGVAYLQIDTYGSTERKFQDKKSQSIRFAPTAIAELKSLIDRHFKEA